MVRVSAIWLTVPQKLKITCVNLSMFGFGNRSLEWPLCARWRRRQFHHVLTRLITLRPLTAARRPPAGQCRSSPATHFPGIPLSAATGVCAVPYCSTGRRVSRAVEDSRRLIEAFILCVVVLFTPEDTARSTGREGRGANSRHLSARSCRRPEAVELYERFAVKGFFMSACWQRRLCDCAVYSVEASISKHRRKRYGNPYHSKPAESVVVSRSHRNEDTYVYSTIYN